MHMVKILAKVLFSLIIILAIVGYFAVRNFDLNQYKSYAADFVARETGRELVINGDAKLGISLVPTVIINDVALSNASWARQPEMIRVKQLEVKINILALLKKRIVIDKILLDGPEIYLETSADGAQNWVFGSSSAVPAAKASANGASSGSGQTQAVSSPAAAALAGFAAKDVSIVNGVVSYYDAAKNQTQALQINTIHFSAPSSAENMTAAFDVVYNGQEISGEMTLGALQTLLANQEPYPFTLTAEALGLDVDLSGSAADVMSSPRYAVQANVYNPAGNLNAPETTLKALINGDVKQAEAQIQTLNIVNNLITGTVKADWSGSLPSVDAVLSSAKIDLQSFGNSKPLAFKLPSLVNEAQALEMVPATAVPYEVLKTLNAKADVTIGELLIAPGMQADNVKMSAVLQNGVLTVNPLMLGFGGGTADASAIINANSRSVQLKLVTQNMKLQNLHEEFKINGNGDFGVSEGGQVDLDINLSGSGDNYRQIAESLKGSVIAIVGQSVVQTGALDFMSGNFVTQLLNMLKIDTSKAKQMDLSCAVVRADLGGGKAVFPKGIVFNAKQLTLVSDGSINLANDKIDFTLLPFSGTLDNTNVMSALSSFVKIAGTLENPKVTLDSKETLKTLIGVAATGGTAYVGSQLLLDSDSSPCYTALAGTPYANRFPKPEGVKATSQDVYKDVNKQIDNTVKDLKDAAKDFLGAFTKKK